VAVIVMAVAGGGRSPRRRNHSSGPKLRDFSPYLTKRIIIGHGSSIRAATKKLRDFATT